MKRYIVLLVLALLVMPLPAQMKPSQPVVNAKVESIARDKLYSTSNMWTFLKLDTSNGRIWQVQWALDDENRLEVDLSLRNLALEGREVNGRFELYPTTNTYNFLLLDKQLGKVYQVQWAISKENRGILPIEKY